MTTERKTELFEQLKSISQELSAEKVEHIFAHENESGKGGHIQGGATPSFETMVITELLTKESN